MKVTKELLKEMKQGDYVVVKTLGQLIDSGVIIDVEETKVKDVLGKMLPIDYVLIIDDSPLAIISYNNEQYALDEDMFLQLYPLTRGLE